MGSHSSDLAAEAKIPLYSVKHTGHMLKLLTQLLLLTALFTKTSLRFIFSALQDTILTARYK